MDRSVSQDTTIQSLPPGEVEGHSQPSIAVILPAAVPAIAPLTDPSLRCAPEPVDGAVMSTALLGCPDEWRLRSQRHSITCCQVNV